MNILFDNNEIKSYISTILYCGLGETEYEDIYYDSVADKHWIHSSYWSDMLEEELHVLEKSPKLSAKQLIQELMQTDDLKESIAISLALYDRKFDNNRENRSHLIDLFENSIDKATAKQAEKIKMCIRELHMCDSTNRDEIVGKTFAEIEKDATFYRDISERAKRLLEHK